MIGGPGLPLERLKMLVGPSRANCLNESRGNPTIPFAVLWRFCHHMARVFLPQRCFRFEAFRSGSFWTGGQAFFLLPFLPAAFSLSPFALEDLWCLSGSHSLSFKGWLLTCMAQGAGFWSHRESGFSLTRDSSLFFSFCSPFPQPKIVERVDFVTWEGARWGGGLADRRRTAVSLARADWSGGGDEFHGNGLRRRHAETLRRSSTAPPRPRPAPLPSLPLRWIPVSPGVAERAVIGVDRERRV